MNKHIGLDAGSVSVKLAVLDRDGNILETKYLRHKGDPIRVSYELLKDYALPAALSVTGSAGKLISQALGIGHINEVVALSYSTGKLYPDIRTVIEVGGEDSKLILLDNGAVKEFSMNSVCAAGTGSFLDQQAERLNLSIEEFSSIALKSEHPPRIAGRCSVFAKSDMIHLQQIATPVEDIVAGLCFAVARNFKGSISRGRKIIPPVSFQGGVAANKGLVRAFKEIFDLDELFVPECFPFMVAIGAVLKKMHEGTVQHIDLTRLDDFLIPERPLEAGHPPLNDFQLSALSSQPNSSSSTNNPPIPPLVKGGKGGFVKERQEGINSSLPWVVDVTRHSLPRTRAYLGIDICSISTNLAVFYETGRLFAKRYIMHNGRPIEAVRQGLTEVGEEIGD